jgi:hypothetical protein
MADTENKQRVFAASAAALVASHTMADAVWQTYFPELPRNHPEFRTILMDMHQRALLGKSPNLGDACALIEKRFGVEEGTAKVWIKKLVELGFLVRLESEKKSAVRICPSLEAKTGLTRVGEEYLVCLGQMVTQLRFALKLTEADPNDLEWLIDVRRALETNVQDYDTKSAKTEAVQNSRSRQESGNESQSKASIIGG